MHQKPIVITPRDGFDLLAVWEKDGRKWNLLQLARPQSAIALNTVRLVVSGDFNVLGVLFFRDIIEIVLNNAA